MIENNRIEFKQELTVDLEKEVVAFLNYKYGGIIYIGIDKNGHTIGMENPDELQLKIKDRLEITSYGGLFEGMSKDDFFSGLSLPKNKELMRIFRDLDMVEQLGSGVPRILQSYSKECFVFGDSYTRMVFKFESSPKSSVKSSQKILDLIRENKEITTEELAQKLGITRRAIAKQIAKLKEQEKLKRVGPDKGGHREIIEN